MTTDDQAPPLGPSRVRTRTVATIQKAALLPASFNVQLDALHGSGAGPKTLHTHAAFKASKEQVRATENSQASTTEHWVRGYHKLRLTTHAIYTRLARSHSPLK